MKLYYITDGAWDEKHVATVHIDEICANLQRLGHAVTLYLPALGKPSADKPYQLTFVRTFTFMHSVWFQLGLFFTLLRDIRANAPDCLYVRNSSLLFVPALVARITRVPLILEVNGKLSEEVAYEGTLLSKILFYSGIFKAIESFTVATAAGFVAVKEGIKRYLEERYGASPEKIRVILNGVDIKAFAPVSVQEARAAAGLEHEALYVGYIGSFYEWQGLRHIAKAAQLVCAQQGAVTFLLLGSGAEETYLRTFVRDHNLGNRIEIRPAVSHGEIPKYIHSMDICLSYPNRSRGGVTSPFKIYEYLACGKAVVSADIAGMREEFGDTIAYAAPESAEALAQTLIALIDDPTRRKALGEKGRAWVEQGHTWQAVAADTAAFCQSLLR